MSVTLLGSLLLAVSLISVVIYMVALGQILVNPRQPGMVRTACSRLFAALLYVGVGLLTLQTNEKGPLVGLGVFTVVQLIWQANSIADIRLARMRKKVSEPVGNHRDDELTDPVPNYAPKLADAVVSAEIDRLSTKVSESSQDIDAINDVLDSHRRVRSLGFGILAFVAVVAVIGLIFGLFVYNKAARADEQAHINTLAINEIRATQARLDTTVHEFCDLYALFIGTYNQRSRAASPTGPETYDANFNRLVRSAAKLQCGIKTPDGLTGGP